MHPTHQSSSSTLIINIGEKSHLILPNKVNTKSKISNCKHTQGSYPCFYCKLCISSCSKVSLIPCVLSLILISSFIVGGYYTVLYGIKEEQEVCEVTNVNVTSYKCTITHQECTGFRAQRTCEPRTETRDCYDATVTYQRHDGTDSSFFECGTVFIGNINGSTEYQPDINAGSTSPCKSTCSGGGEGAIYFCASMLFLVACCCCWGIIIGSIRVNPIEWKDGAKNMKNLYHGKNKFYEYQWSEVMNEDDRFDYVMNYWIRHYCANGYESINDGGICYEIESVIYDYYYAVSE